ncbi:hypothetical protein FRB99_002060 [Tulasnella sp. 403]|nr:hypothetical protein FRB99_002060 [Tulasnella sp. 403]
MPSPVGSPRSKLSAEWCSLPNYNNGVRWALAVKVMPSEYTNYQGAAFKKVGHFLDYTLLGTVRWIVIKNPFKPNLLEDTHNYKMAVRGPAQELVWDSDFNDDDEQIDLDPVFAHIGEGEETKGVHFPGESGNLRSLMEDDCRNFFNEVYQLVSDLATENAKAGIAIDYRYLTRSDIVFHQSVDAAQIINWSRYSLIDGSRGPAASREGTKAREWAQKQWPHDKLCELKRHTPGYSAVNSAGGQAA